MESGLKVSKEAVIRAYKEGQSMNSIAKMVGTYTSTVKRILEKHGVELRHDAKKEGSLYVKDGEKLIEWAKTQGRPVTRAELAAVIGRKRLSPSYFLKYPELGQYVIGDEQREFKEYYDKLYKWLQENDIPYKPNDRTKLKVSVDALLLGDYTGIALQIVERPKCVSTKIHEGIMIQKLDRARDAGLTLICLNKEDFADLDKLKHLLTIR